MLGSNAGLSGRTLDIISPELRAGMVVSFERTAVPDWTDCADVR